MFLLIVAGKMGNEWTAALLFIAMAAVNSQFGKWVKNLKKNENETVSIQ